MRRLAHKAIAIFFWIVLVVLWYALVVEGRRGRTSHWKTDRVAVDDEAVALA